ncbi:MAG: quinone-dependent dihydroorotate dehydrogenase [Candidatus Doudnabacteria bacterium]|nr:quinone-dependent dihydroorotate dehydrogenase [Candidatus Doudnabacteria bacterium]
MSIFAATYRRVFKPIAFRFDPESVHDIVLAVGKQLGKTTLTRMLTRRTFAYAHPMLEQDILGMHFLNPIGLAAGFDKNAELLQILPEVGFGFVEVGSITGEPCAGNARPRLWRIPEAKSLLVYYGLKNDGAEAISARLQGRLYRVPVGISVAKTNNMACADREAGIADYVKAHQLTAGIGAYTTVNISCPNAYGGQPFTDPESLDGLLTAVDAVQTAKPVFVKLSPDLSEAHVDALLEVLAGHRVQGVVCSNLTKDHTHAAVAGLALPEQGGLSGKVQEAASNAQLAHVYRKTQGKYILVGCGGVFSAEDAYKKIRLGASLVQLITGMIFEGPSLIGEINRGLVQLMQRDGYSHIQEAIGVDVTGT